MNFFGNSSGNDRSYIRSSIPLIVLIWVHTWVCVATLIYAARTDQIFHIFYNSTRLLGALGVIATFAPVSMLFVFADFSLGYFTGYYFYTMILGYLWLNYFTDLNYPNEIAGFSAATSAFAFLLPALFVRFPIRQIYQISLINFDKILNSFLLISAAILLIASSYNFRIVSLSNIYDFRSNLHVPTIVNYMVGTSSNALLPFTFACLFLRRSYWRATAALVLLALFYPITLTKLAFFTPALMLLVALSSSIVGCRITALMTLLVPMLAGLIAVSLFPKEMADIFEIVNLRMYAVPSNALAFYNDFFARHELTHFCQLSILKPIVNCPYRDQLGVVMKQAYGFGNFNASLFATEGVASVGLLLAPLTVFACSVVIALGNSLGAHLPSRLILISTAALPQVFLNVPFTTVLLTHGLAMTFLLWYVTPRNAFAEHCGCM